MTEQQSQNLLLKVDPLSAIRNKFITQGEKSALLKRGSRVKGKGKGSRVRVKGKELRVRVKEKI